MSNIKNVLIKTKYIKKMYQTLKLIYNAILNIKIDLHSLKELKYELVSSVGLGKENYNFYYNFFNNFVKNKNLLFIDVGANDGWFAKVILRFKYDARIISFEPLKSMHDYLEKIKSNHINFNFEKSGLGAEKKSIEIKEFYTSGLSSLKEFNIEYQYDISNFDQKVKNVYQIDIETLDNYVINNNITSDICLKIDTQGFEMEVLTGSLALFQKKQIKIVIIELMTLEKYKDAKLYDEILNFLHNNNFKLFDLHPSYYEENGQLSEFDAIFILKKDN